MQWAPDGKIVFSGWAPTSWSPTVNEFDPKTGLYRHYFSPSSSLEVQTFAFYYIAPPIIRGTMIMMQ